MEENDIPTLPVFQPVRSAPEGMNEPSLGADNYRVGHEIARGGMGSILEAEDGKLKRTVAVKIMHLDAQQDHSARLRFLREAEVLAMLAHPNIVPIYDIVWEHGVPLFYSMKLVKGRTLQHILHGLQNRHPDDLHDYTLDRLLLIFRKVCDAIAFAHSKGVLHRDLKPENVMVGEFGEVLVMDWGLAKWKGQSEADLERRKAAASISSEVLSSLPSLQTLDGSVMGTPQYMSPEQARGQIDELDERSDIFSLGGILYAILTLRPPVEGQTLEEVLSKVTSGQITSPSEWQVSSQAKGKARSKGDVLDARLIKPLPHVSSGRVPPALSAVVMKALRLAKEDRYPTVAHLSADIEAYQGGFATSAEQAGALKQLQLLMLRHKAVTGTLAALLLVCFGFVLKVIASERKATRHAEIAVANEQRANEQAEKTRRALMTSQMAVAESAYRAADVPAMLRALDSIPEDLRDQRWDYLSIKRDSSVIDWQIPGFAKLAAARMIPGRPGQFALANHRGQVGIVDVPTSTILRQIETEFKNHVVIAISADGQRLAISSKQAQQIQIYRIEEGQLEKTVPAPSAGINVMTFSPNGQQLAVLDEIGKENVDSKLYLVELHDGSVRFSHPGCFGSALFSGDGKRLFAGKSIGRALLTFHVEEGKLVNQRDEYFQCMALSQDHSRLAVGYYNGEVAILNAATGATLQRGRLHLGNVTHLAWTAAHQLITIGNEAGIDQGRSVMRLWETSTFSSRGTFLGMKETPLRRYFDFHPLSGHLLVIGSRSTTAQLWHIPTGLEAARIISPNAQQGWATCFLSNTLLLNRVDYGLQRFDVSTPSRPNPVHPKLLDGYHIMAIHRPDGLVAIGNRTSGAPPRNIKLYRLHGSELTPLHELPMSGLTTRLDFDPTGSRLLALSTSLESLVFEVSSGKTLLKIPQRLHRAVFVGAGDRIAAILSQKRAEEEVVDHLCLMDASQGKIIKKLTYHVQQEELVTSPDRKLIAMAGAEQIIRIFDAETLEERANFRAHDAEITALAFHPTQPRLASASPDGSVKIWDYHTAELVQQFLGLNGAPVMLAFSPNGRLLSVEGQEKMSRLYDLNAPTAGSRVPSRASQ